MTLNIPSLSGKEAGLTEVDLRQELALTLYKQEKVSLGKAAEIAGVDRWAFQALMKERGVFINFDVEDLDNDVTTLKKLGML
jgi:predicted HTH domain antitoxin